MNIRKFGVFGAILAAGLTLAACGGGGDEVGGGDEATCTPSTVEGPEVVVSSTASSQTLNDSGKYQVRVTGAANSLYLDGCVHVTKLIIEGDANSITAKSGTKVDAVEFAEGSANNTVNLLNGQRASSTDAGTGNTLVNP